MPAISCPQCGAPTRVSLYTPDVMACPSCRYAGPPPPATRQGLIAAAQVLASIDVRRRQLGWAQQRVGAGARTGGGVGCFFAVLLAPFVGCGGCLYAATRTGGLGDVGIAVFFLGPAAVMIVAGLVILRELEKTRRQTELACAAVPPAVPGAAHGCHVCGADLQAFDLSRQAVVRCRFCAADNVVRADVLGRAASLAAAAADDVLTQARAHAMALVKQRGRASVLLALLALLAPFASCVGLASASCWSPSVEPTNDYVLVRTEQGACIGEVQPLREHAPRQVIIGSNSPAGALPKFPLPEGAPTFRARALVGHVLVAGAGRRAKAARVERSGFLGTEDVFLEDKPEIGGWPGDYCVEDPGDDFTLIDPPAKP
jgi:hypothetical protein